MSGILTRSQTAVHLINTKNGFLLLLGVQIKEIPEVAEREQHFTGETLFYIIVRLHLNMLKSMYPRANTNLMLLMLAVTLSNPRLRNQEEHF